MTTNHKLGIANLFALRMIQSIIHYIDGQLLFPNISNSIRGRNKITGRFDCMDNQIFGDFIAYLQWLN